MPATRVAHPSDDVLEAYLLGHLDAEASDTVEAHILPCQQCLDRVEAMEENISCLKSALQSFVETPSQTQERALFVAH